MGNQQNIEPHKFKPGQSGNPQGRPKGSLNSKTILKKWLSTMTERKNPITKQIENMPVLEAATLSVIGKALQGDVYAFNSLIDRMEGKPNQRIEATGAEGGPIETVSTNHNIDYSKLSESALLEIIAAGNTINDNAPTPTKNGTKGKSTGNKKKGS